jgi:Carbohydrate binding domain
MKKLLLYCILGIFLSFYQKNIAQNFTGGYNFTLPYNDSTTQLFLPDFPKNAITDADKITAIGDKFYSNGNSIRFWGVNISASACFPSKALAPQIAGRMRKMGINLVRIHHYDNPWSGDNGTIFKYSNGTRSLDPTQLDLLEYFIAQLKDNGIYVDINLNNSRTFQTKDGIPEADSLQEFGKGVTLFDPWLQSLQREHAQQYLTHVNPYTGKALINDPVVAMIELNNENTLYGMWKSNQLTTFAKGGILPARFDRKLDSLFCTFLKNKYPSQSALNTAWSASGAAASNEKIINGTFESGTIAPWSVELQPATAAVFTTSATTPATGTRSGLLNVTQVSGTDWHIQLKQSGIVLANGDSYQLIFKARTNGANKTINVSFLLDQAPYTYYTGSDVTLTSTWQTFKISFTAPSAIPNLRISMSPKQNIGQFYFDDISFDKPKLDGVLASENLNSCTVLRVPYNERLNYSTQRMADVGEFYMQLQKTHFDAYYNFVKNTLGAKAPISGTNALVGPQDVQHSTNMDYTDDHSYWNHPEFPGGGWSTTNWSVANQPLFKDQLTQSITNVMAGLNIANKPYTISEYNHAYPNRFRTEMVHGLAAYSGFHGVDGVMFFQYETTKAEYLTDKVTDFFEIDSDHSIMSLFPSCAYAYRHNLIAEDIAPLQVNYSSQWIYDQTKTDSKGRWDKLYSYDQRIALTHKVHSNYNQAAYNNSSVSSFTPSTIYTTANNETKLDQNKGVLTTNTPKFVAITGDISAASNTIVGAMKLNTASDFGSVTWISSDDQQLNNAKYSLLTISTKQQNTGMIWNGTQTVNGNWGNSPTEQKPINTSLTLNINADTLYLYPLNTLGKESTFRKIVGNNKQFTVNIDQNSEKTTWFGLRAVSNCDSSIYAICAGETYKLEITDPTLTNVQWFFDDGLGAGPQAIAGATGAFIDVSKIGFYTYSAHNLSGCAVGNCCPVQLKAGTNCCKPVICGKVKITKK